MTILNIPQMKHAIATLLLWLPMLVLASESYRNPVIKSSDMVNWETIGYVFDRIDDGDRPGRHNLNPANNIKKATSTGLPIGGGDLLVGTSTVTYPPNCQNNNGSQEVSTPHRQDLLSPFLIHFLRHSNELKIENNLIRCNLPKV